MASYNVDRNDYENLDDDEIRDDITRRHLDSRTSSSDNLLGQDQVDAIPRDKAGFIWCGFVILGVTTLVPWNSFVTDTDYWMYKFRNVTHPDQNERTKLQTFFESYLSIASTMATVVAMVLTSLFGCRFKQKTLINVPLVMIFMIFILTTSLAYQNTDSIQYIFLGLTIIMVTAVSFLSAVFQAGLFGYTANFPSHCMYSMLNGQAVAGLLITFVQLTTLALDLSPKWSGISYFTMSTIFVGIALVYYHFMDNEYTRHYARLASSNTGDRNSTSNRNLLENGQDLLESIKECWRKALTVIIVFFATLSMFPSVCVLVLPHNPNSSFLTGRFFVPLMVFLIYNTCDLLGRLLSTVVPFPRGKQNSLLALTIIRSIIPALIIFCNVVVPGRTLPIIFNQDAYFGILVGLTGLTQGYIFSSAMVLASLEASPNKRELTGFIMATCLGLGLALGSVNSTLIISLLGR